MSHNKASDFFACQHYPQPKFNQTAFSRLENGLPISGCSLFVSPYCYRGKIRDTIVKVKTAGKICLAKDLVFNAIAKNEEWFSENSWDFIVPIPAHPLRAAKRGFDLPYLLANAISLRVRNSKLNRKDTQIIKRRFCSLFIKQALSTKSERYENAKRIFKLGRVPEDLENCSILLVDDVTTSGATINIAINLIKQVKPARIDCYVLAHTISR